MSIAVTFALHDTRQSALEAVIEAGLDEFNASAGFFREQAPLCCIARDPGGAVVGGVVGRTLGQCCEIKLLWVGERFRHSGVGSELLTRFEKRAVSRGCSTFYLTTFSFQGKPFYERMGYQVKLEIAGHGPGISKYIMLRQILDEAAV